MEAKELTNPARVQSLLTELDWCIANGHVGPRTLQAIEHARAVLAALHSDAAQAPPTDDARNLVTLDRRDLWDYMRGAIHAALNDKIPKDCVVSWAWEEATNRTMDIFQKIVDVAPGAAAQGEVVRVPEGYALMPLKPTAEIVKAGGEARIADFKLNGTTLSVKDANRVSEAMYRAMIDAALATAAPSTGDLGVES